MCEDRPAFVEQMKRMAREFEGDKVADVLAEAIRRITRAENALLSFTPSGSEYFLRDGDGFRIDVDACSRVIRENYDKGHRAMIEAAQTKSSPRRQRDET